MTTIADRLRELAEAKFSEMSGGQTTQLIVGASPESDAVILRLAQHLYTRFNVRRVYYSAFRPEGTDPSLPHPAAPPYGREFRLYQADMLFRWYGFSPQELFVSSEFLDEDIDPKTSWALRNVEFFPVELMTAEIEQLLRVPGIGPRSAHKILELRKAGRLSVSSLKRLGIRLKYASWFITLHGKSPVTDLRGLWEIPPRCALDHPEMLRAFLRDKPHPTPPTTPELDFSS
jgi:predicted DNA-binding helix-hairpin-helix protein